MTMLDDVMAEVRQTAQVLSSMTVAEQMWYTRYGMSSSYRYACLQATDTTSPCNVDYRKCHGQPRSLKLLKLTAYDTLIEQAAQAVVLMAEAQGLCQEEGASAFDTALDAVHSEVRWELSARNNPDGCTRYDEWAYIRRGWLDGGGMAAHAGVRASLATAAEAILLLLDEAEAERAA